MLELVFVHVPKAGGSSVDQILRAKYGRRLRLAYSVPQSPLSRAIRSRARRLLQATTAFPARCIASHRPASAFEDYEANLITFVRDPFDIRVSAWNYIRRMNAETGVVMNDDWRDALENSLMDFVLLPSRPISWFLDVPLSRFSFVGDMHHFEQDLRKLCESLGVPFFSVHANAGKNNEGLDEAARREFERVNPAEVQMYKAAKARRREILQTL